MSAFDTLISAAKEREQSERRAKEQRATDQAAARAAQQAKREEEARCSAIFQFGHGFLDAVARRVVSNDWQSAYIVMIKDYSQGLLRKTEQQLPKINERHAASILDKFEYGLQLAAERGNPIPDGTFYGQELLAVRQNSRPERRERISYTIAKQAPRAAGPAVSSTSSQALPPATTPKTKKDRRRVPA